MNQCENCKNYYPMNKKCPRCGELKPANKFHQSVKTYFEYICRECLDAELKVICGLNKSYKTLENTEKKIKNLKEAYKRTKDNSINFSQKEDEPCAISNSWGEEPARSVREIIEAGFGSKNVKEALINLFESFDHTDE